VKTIEEILGIEALGLNDAIAAPTSDVFDQNAADWSYKEIVPDVRRSNKLHNHRQTAFPMPSPGIPPSIS
jgi:hypothetical protein